jgi:competence protein ComEC
LGAIWLLPVFLITPPRPAQGEAWFTLLDVGQGLASVVQTHNHTLVYDTGPKFNDQFDAGRAVIIPYFRSQGLAEIDMLVIGHGDADHIGGADSVAREIKIEQVLSSVPAKIFWMNALPCGSGQQWQWDGVDFHMLHPPQLSVYKGNNSSCVLRISNRAGSVLLTGDIEKGAEKSLLEQQRELLSSRILVVPHHGSRTSSTLEFLEAVRPEYVIFPVGYKNRFGFPREDVLKRYQSIDAKLYNSAQHGAVSFKLGADGTLLPPDAYRQNHKRYWHIGL